MTRVKKSHKVVDGAQCGSDAARRCRVGICRTQDAFSNESVHMKTKLPIKAIFLKCALAFIDGMAANGTE